MVQGRGHVRPRRPRLRAVTTDLRAEHAAPRPLLVRSTMSRLHDADVPAYRYLRAEDGTWVDFDSATRFDPDTATGALPVATGSHPDATREWVRDLPRDLDGWPFDPNAGPYVTRLTLCCAAACSISDGPLYCKSCFLAQDLAADTPPRLDGDWNPGDGPVTVRLG